MRVDQQMVFSVHRITVRCNQDGCMRQASVYVSGGLAGSIEEQLAQIGWHAVSNETHFCLEHQ